MVHGYMSNAGFEDVRGAIAQSLNRRFGTKVPSGKYPDDCRRCQQPECDFKDDFKSLQDQVVTFAPYFVEYGNYVRKL